MAKPTAVLKKQKKNWIEIVSPKQFGYKTVGETPAYEAGQTIGRTLSVNLSRLAGDIKKQNVNVTLQIVDVKDNKAQTVVKNVILQTGSIRRMVRPGTSRLDDSFSCRTKDGKRTRIKTLFVTRARVKGSVKRTLRKEAMNFLKKEIEKSTFDEFVGKLVSFSVQKELKDILTKVYPLKTAQIQWFGYEKEKIEKPVETEEPAEPAEEAKEEAAEEKPAKKVKKAKKKVKKAVKKEEAAEEPEQEAEPAEEAEPEAEEPAEEKEE
ncbi:hypothetical protein KY316_01950 [Candidatus Woesearchaeota archaeon]|nr:hypothetical protein [Candidatus Woesearchaeota archaeon]